MSKPNRSCPRGIRCVFLLQLPPDDMESFVSFVSSCIGLHSLLGIRIVSENSCHRSMCFVFSDASGNLTVRSGFARRYQTTRFVHAQRKFCELRHVVDRMTRCGLSIRNSRCCCSFLEDVSNKSVLNNILSTSVRRIVNENYQLQHFS